MNVPQLRFDGFDGEWEVKKLNEMAEISSGGTPSRKKGEYWNGDIPWVTTSEVKFNNIFEAKEYITDKGLQESSAKLFPMDTILVAMYGQGQTRGKSAVLKIEAATNQACAAIKVEKAFESQLIYQLLSYKYNELRDLSNDGSQKNLSLGLLSSFKLIVPSLKEEQRKIAIFMNFLDQRIKKQEEKNEQLKQLKKGMMQKIFSQELRFKDEDGGEFPEWEEKKLDKCLDIENGFPFKSSYFTTEKLGMPLLRIRDIKAEKLNTYYTGSFDEKYLVDNQDVVIGMDGEFAVSKWNKGPALLNQRVMRIKSKEGYSLSYLYQLLKIVVKKIEDITPQTTVKHLSNKDIFNSIIKIPNFDEQQKIGNFFSGIDTKIEKEKEKLMVLEEQKNGFMQGMFV